MKGILKLLVLLLLVGCASRSVPQSDGPIYLPAKNYPDRRITHHIVIDPGHGGNDKGTNSEDHPKYEEKVLNLATAKHLQKYLRQLGYTSEMTRHDDVFVPLDKRSSFANKINPGLFVSVHYNSAPNPNAEGIEVFYYKSKDDVPRSAASQKAAEAILAKATHVTEAKSRGARHGNYAVIRETKMPAILVEGGFLTNNKERNKILDDKYRRKLAWGIAMGIDDYFKPKES